MEKFKNNSKICRQLRTYKSEKWSEILLWARSKSFLEKETRLITPSTPEQSIYESILQAQENPLGNQPKTNSSLLRESEV